MTTKPKDDISNLAALVSAKKADIERIQQAEQEIGTLLDRINKERMAEIERLKLRVVELEDFVAFTVLTAKSMLDRAGVEQTAPQTLRQL